MSLLIKIKIFAGGTRKVGGGTAGEGMLGVARRVLWEGERFCLHLPECNGVLKKVFLSFLIERSIRNANVKKP